MTTRLSGVEEGLTELFRGEAVRAAPPEILDAALARVATTGQVSRRLRLVRTEPTGSRSRAFALVAIAAAIAIIGVAIATTGATRPDGTDRRALPTAPAVVQPTSSSAIASLPADTLGIGTTIDLPIVPESVVTGFGSVWVAGVTDEYKSPAELLRINPSTGDVARVPLSFDACSNAFDTAPDLQVGFGSLWLSDCKSGAILRVNPDTYKVQASFSSASLLHRSISEHLVAFDSRSAFVVRDPRAGTIDRVDAATSRATPFVKVGGEIVDIAVDGSRLWVIASSVSGRVDGLNSIDVIDIATKRITTAATFDNAASLAVVDRDLWVTVGAHDGSKILAVTQGSSPVTFGIGGEAGALVYADGLVWTTRNRFDLVGIDPVSRETVHHVALEMVNALAAGDGTMWAVADTTRKLFGIPLP